MHTYILIETQVGRTGDVLNDVIRVHGIVGADSVSGPFDVVARAETDGFAEIAEHVLAHIAAIDGVTRTITCPVVGSADRVLAGALG